MELKCIIIDDEPLASKVLINFANRAGDLIVLDTFETIKEGFDYLKSIDYQLDIVFLDVGVNKKSSIDYLEETGEDKLINIVFTSAYQASKFQDRNVQYFDWLEKSIAYRTFEAMLTRFRNR
jgi:two-component SAPR family response regulator